MKKNLSRMLSFALAIVLAVGLLPAGAMGVDTSSVGYGGDRPVEVADPAATGPVPELRTGASDTDFKPVVINGKATTGLLSKGGAHFGLRMTLVRFPFRMSWDVGDSDGGKSFKELIAGMGMTEKLYEKVSIDIHTDGQSENDGWFGGDVFSTSGFGDSRSYDVTSGLCALDFIDLAGWSKNSQTYSNVMSLGGKLYNDLNNLSISGASAGDSTELLKRGNHMLSYISEAPGEYSWTPQKGFAFADADNEHRSNADLAWMAYGENGKVNSLDKYPEFFAADVTYGGSFPVYLSYLMYRLTGNDVYLSGAASPGIDKPLGMYRAVADFSNGTVSKRKNDSMGKPLNGDGGITAADIEIADGYAYRILYEPLIAKSVNGNFPVVLTLREWLAVEYYERSNPGTYVHGEKMTPCSRTMSKDGCNSMIASGAISLTSHNGGFRTQSVTQVVDADGKPQIKIESFYPGSLDVSSDLLFSGNTENGERVQWTNARFNTEKACLDTIESGFGLSIIEPSAIHNAPAPISYKFDLTIDKVLDSNIPGVSELSWPVKVHLTGVDHEGNIVGDGILGILVTSGTPQTLHIESSDSGKTFKVKYGKDYMENCVTDENSAVDNTVFTYKGNNNEPPRKWTISVRELSADNKLLVDADGNLCVDEDGNPREGDPIDDDAMYEACGFTDVNNRRIVRQWLKMGHASYMSGGGVSESISEYQNVGYVSVPFSWYGAGSQNVTITNTIHAIRVTKQYGHSDGNCALAESPSELKPDNGEALFAGVEDAMREAVTAAGVNVNDMTVSPMSVPWAMNLQLCRPERSGDVWVTAPLSVDMAVIDDDSEFKGINRVHQGSDGQWYTDMDGGGDGIPITGYLDGFGYAIVDRDDPHVFPLSKIPVVANEDGVAFLMYMAGEEGWKPEDEWDAATAKAMAKIKPSFDARVCAYSDSNDDTESANHIGFWLLPHEELYVVIPYELMDAAMDPHRNSVEGLGYDQDLIAANLVEYLKPGQLYGILKEACSWNPVCADAAVKKLYENGIGTYIERTAYSPMEAELKHIEKYVMPDSTKVDVPDGNLYTGDYVTTGLPESYTYVDAPNCWYVTDEHIVTNKAMPLTRTASKTHVLIDYNLNGIPATESSSVTGSTVTMSQVGAEPVDCGDLDAGQTYTFGLAFQGQPLKVGNEYSFGQVKNSADNDKPYDIKAKFLGLSKTAGGTPEITAFDDQGQFSYTVPSKTDALDVLYCRWELKVDIPSGEVSEPVGTEYNLTTIYWDKGYESGGITSNLVGTFSIPYYTQAWHYVTVVTEDGSSTTYYNDEGNHYANPGSSSSALTADEDSRWKLNDSVNVHFLPSAPAVYRDNYHFVGWSDDSRVGDGIWKPAEVAALRESLKGNLPTLVTGMVDNLTKVYDDPTYNPGLGSENGANTNTLFAIWQPQDIHWNANGGSFDLGHDAIWDTDEGVTENDVWMYTQYGATDPFGAMDQCLWHGVIHSVNLVPIVKRIPEREGYTFKGWYCDPNCTIPLVRSLDGVLPNVTYHAGWEAEKVRVNYYDSRQGTSLITTQEYDFDDVFMPIANVHHTDGWGSNGWYVATVSDEGELTKADGGKQLTRGMRLAPDTVNAVSDSAMTYYPSDKSHWYVSQTNTFSKDAVKDGTELSDAGYWEINLIADYERRNASYDVNILWNDYNNNDGARPVSVEVGLVNATTGREVDAKTITGGREASVWTDTFKNLPITTSDSSTEKIEYNFYVKAYTDIDGDRYVIQDTKATNGQIACAAVSNADTTVMALYDYAIDHIGVSDGGNGEENNGHPDSEEPLAWDSAYAGAVYFNHNLITTGDDVKFTVQWDDDSDRDGKRPGAVTLTLYAGDVPVQDWTGDGAHQSNTGVVSVSPAMCEVSADGNVWTYTFKDFQKYSNGNFIKYSVKVSDVDGYAVQYHGDAESGRGKIGATLTHGLKKGPVEGRVVWNDGGNRDGNRPDDVTVGLYAYQWNRQTGAWEDVLVATKSRSNADINTAESWDFDFGEQYVYHDGKEVLYKLAVASDLNADKPAGANDYTWVQGLVGNPVRDTEPTCSVIVSHDRDLTEVPVTVYWDDDADNDGIRPRNVILQLYAHKPGGTPAAVDGQAYRVTLSGDGEAANWTYTFRDVPRYAEGASGTELVYTVRAVEATGEPLYGTYGATVNHAAVDFPRYEASYLDGEDSTADPSRSDRAYVKLTHDIMKVPVKGAIRWNDYLNKDGHRPAQVTVSLSGYQWNDGTYRWEDVLAATQVVDVGATEANTFLSFGEQPVFHDRERVIYRMAVTSDLNVQVPAGTNGYTWVEGLTGNQFDNPNEHIVDVTVSHDQDLTDVLVTVHWDDNGDNDDIRPDNVVLQLYAHKPGEAPESVEGHAYRVDLTGDKTAADWHYTFRDVPRFAAGEVGVELVYSVKVIEADGEPLYGYYLTTANGYEQEVLRYEASYLHEADDGTAEHTTEFDLSDRAYVKLYHPSETQTMNFSVNWHDDDDRDGIRPASVDVDLYKTVGDGEPVYLRTLTIVAGVNGTWTYKCDGLPNYEDGQAVKYVIRVRDDVAGNLASQGYTATAADNIVHLYHTPATGGVSVALSWSDDDDNDGYRPDGVKATLYANGVATDLVAELNAGNGWSARWDDLPVHDTVGTAHGVDVAYSVAVEVPEGYEAAYTPASTTIEQGMTLEVSLVHEADVRTVPVEVHWNDGKDQDGIRPDSLKVVLYADGQPTGAVATLTGDGNVWSHAFEGMPTYRGDGEKVYYTVHAYDDVTGKGYSSMTTGTTMYLFHDPVASSMYVSFQFDDDNDVDGKRMTGLYVRLTANGVAVEESKYKHTQNFQTDGNSYTFGALPVYDGNGDKIAYNVSVVFAPELGGEGYTVWTSEDITLDETAAAAEDQVIVKLSREAATGSREGHIYWFDCNDGCGNRPDFLRLMVTDDYSDAQTMYTVNAKTGKVTTDDGREAGTVTVTEWTGDSSVWTYTINNLRDNYVNASGMSSPVFYYAKVNQANVSAYYGRVVDGDNGGLDVALTCVNYETNRKQATQDFTVNVNWVDNGDAWGYRPDTKGVKLDLLANGEVYDSVLLESSMLVKGNGNAWTYTFRSLPTFRDGGGIAWTAELADVERYAKAETVRTAEAVTVSYTQSVGFDFTVVWDDSDDDDAVRPDYLDLNVMGDDKVLATVRLTGEGNRYHGSVTGMPVWREVDADAAVRYGFRWPDETGKYLSDTGYSASATKGGVPVESETTYWLSATAFGDNEDAGYDALTGTYGWETTLSYSKTVADYPFDILFRDDADRDGKRPESVTVNLLANGTAVDAKTVAIDPDDSLYQVVWEQRDVMDGGEAVTYTMELAEVPEGYALTDGDADIVLTYGPETVTVTGTVVWDDSTQKVSVYNAKGQFVREYFQIGRADLWFQLYRDGEPFGEPVLVPESTYGEGEGRLDTQSVSWDGMAKYHDHGTAHVFDVKVRSDGLTAMLEDGYGLTYGKDGDYAFTATVAHDLYDITGTAYYMYTYNTDFLMKGVPVTAYLQGEDGSLTATASTVTGDDGTFAFRNLPQGYYVIRATYAYGERPLAGTKGVRLDRQDSEGNIVVIDRDATADGDYYLYAATGKAMLQTDAGDASTIRPVPAGSVALLYRTVDGQAKPEYVGMTTTDGEGRYSFGGLGNGSYIVNVVFNYEGGVYTFDNADALASGLSFRIAGADMAWPDIVKQVNASVAPIDPERPDEPTPDVPEQGPRPCVVSGSVLYDDDGVHTTDPVEGVDVYVYLAANNREMGKAVTDADGRWSVDGLGAAEYVAVFSYEGNASRVLRFTVTDADHEAGTYEAAPQYFDRGVSVPTGIIKGIVLDEDGSPLDAMVAIYDGSGDVVDFARTTADGFYGFTVVAGYDYQVKLLSVETSETRLTAGDPDDDLTTLDYYTLSGVFGIDGVLQKNALVAVYHEGPDGFALVTATLTDDQGRFEAKVYEEGNYRVCPYLNDKAFEERYVSVGYQDERPSVTRAANGYYTISGIEDHQAYDLTKTVDGVVIQVAKADGLDAHDYAFPNLDAGSYRLVLTDGGRETTYYVSVPTGTGVAVDYKVTVSGKVLGADGKAVLGSSVTVLDKDGKPVGPETTILSDGGYEYRELPSGMYTVAIEAANASETLDSRWTYEDDSYGVRYPDGMAKGGEWVLNRNAHKVTGKVTDQLDRPIAGARVTFAQDGGAARYEAETAEDGSYVLGVAPGGYDVRAAYAFDEAHTFGSHGTVFVRVDADKADVGLVIDRYDVTVETVRGTDGAAVADADVAVRFEDGTVFWSGKTDGEGKALVTAFPGTYVFTGAKDGVETSVTEGVSGDATVRLALDTVTRVTGTVRTDDGNVVKDGIVYYDNGNGLSGHVFTDDEGCYGISLQPSELGELTVYAASGTDVGEPTTVSVVSDVTLDLTVVRSGVTAPLYVLSGIVTDEEGNRLADAIVTIRWGNDKSNTKRTSTDSMGRYAFEVEDGTYYLTAEYEAEGSTYVTNAEYAVHVDGGDLTQDLMVLMGYDVTVMVTDVDGLPVADATVRYEGVTYGSGVTDADGVVVLHLPAGEYEFRASAGSRSCGPVRATVTAGTGVTLVMDAVGIKPMPPEVTDDGLTLWGYVLDGDGVPCEGTDVTLEWQDLETLEWSVLETGTTDADGRYGFSGLEDGTYRVSATATSVADVEPTQTNPVVDGIAVNGSGDPLANATVELWFGDDLRETCVTGEDGAYVFRGVELDETYRVVVTDATGKAVSDEDVTAHGSESSVEGIVTDVAGRPVEGATVTVTDGNGDTVTVVTTDADGVYAVAVDEADGPFAVRVECPVSYEVETETYERDTTDRSAPYLEPSWYTISGMVEDEDGDPVEDATVTLKDADGLTVDEMVTGADGKYLFDRLTDGIYRVEVSVRDRVVREYGVSVPAGPDVGGEEFIDVTVTDMAGAVVDAPEAWADGEDTFRVTAGSGCVVLVRGSDGKLTRLYGTMVGDDTCEFTHVFHDGDEVVVALKGDADLDGRTSITDASVIARWCALGGETDELWPYVSDSDGDGRVSITDASVLARMLSRSSLFDWDLR